MSHPSGLAPIYGVMDRITHLSTDGLMARRGHCVTRDKLAEVFALAHLRLTEKRRHDAVSPHKDRSVSLDSPAQESAPVVKETLRWRRPCSVKSTGFDR